MSRRSSAFWNFSLYWSHAHTGRRSSADGSELLIRILIPLGSPGTFTPWATSVGFWDPPAQTSGGISSPVVMRAADLTPTRVSWACGVPLEAPPPQDALAR